MTTTAYVASPWAPSQAVLAASRSARVAFTAALVALFAGILYWVTGPQGSGGDEYIPLADAFLHGHLLVGPRSWVELVPMGNDLWAVPFPPIPTLFYLPVVFLMGHREWWSEMGVGVMPSFVGGATVGLAYLTLRNRLNLSASTALWITAAFGTTTLWWVAGMGGTHLMAETSAAFFTFAALYLALGRRLPAVAGLLFALAVGSRLPVVMAFPLFIYLYRGQIWQFVAGVAPVAVALAAYNFARFGSPLDNGYALIPSGNGLVTDEPWYRDGIESWSYIPRGLHAMLLSGLDIFHPTWAGSSILLTAPFVLWALSARGRLAAIGGIAIAGVLLIDLMHGETGAAQFGYRFFLDAMPFVVLLVGLVVQKSSPSVWFRGAVVAGALVTLWGVWFLNVLS